MFKDCCAELYIQHRFTSIRHPQSNKEVEIMNQIILQGLMTKLDETKGRWVDELTEVLWTNHTILRTSINETPFSLAIGIEV